MSKFDELCEFANTAVVADFQYKERCKQFGSELTQGLMAYLECPDDRAVHYLIREGEKLAPARMMDDATYETSDGWWHTGIGIDLTKRKPGAMVVGRTILFNLIYKAEKDRYLVRFGRDDKEFRIHPGNKTEADAFYNHLFASLKESFEKEKEWLNNPQKPNRFGFGVYLDKKS